MNYSIASFFVGLALASVVFFAVMPGSTINMALIGTVSGLFMIWYLADAKRHDIVPFFLGYIVAVWVLV